MDIETLEKLVSLKEKGVLTEDEFNLKKQEILASVAKNGNTGAGRNVFSSYGDCFKKYFDFKGRSTRFEYWSFVLVNFLINVFLSILEGVDEQGEVLSLLYSLAALIPGISVQVRRLHDINRSGWWLFGYVAVAFCFGFYLGWSEDGGNDSVVGVLALAFIIATIVMLVWMCIKSDEKANDYGEPMA